MDTNHFSWIEHLYFETEKTRKIVLESFKDYISKRLRYDFSDGEKISTEDGTVLVVRDHKLYEGHSSLDLDQCTYDDMSLLYDIAYAMEYGSYPLLKNVSAV